jgi:hypothetical protein
LRNRLFRFSSVCFALVLGLAGACHAQTSTVAVNADVFIVPSYVQIQAGQTVTFTASGSANISDDNGGYTTDPNGTITIAPAPGTGAYMYFTQLANPSGVPPQVGMQKYPTDVFTTDLNAPFGALVGSFGPDPTGDQLNTWFTVGASSTFTAPYTGYLYFSVNDFDNTNNDEGTYSVTIKAQSHPIAAVEFTQAIQQYQSLSDLKTYLGAHNQPPVPIVAGKPAVMRIYYNPPSEFTGYALTVTGAASDSESMALLPNCTPLAQRARTAPCYATDVFFTPPSGTWSVNIVLADALGNQVDNETLSVMSTTSATMNLAAVKECDTFEDYYTGLPTGSYCGDPTQLLPLSGLLGSMMPTSLVKVTQTGSEDTQYEEVSTGPSGLPSFFEFGQTAADDLAFDYYQPAEWASDASFDQYTTYVGVGPGGIGRIQAGSAVAFPNGPVGDSLVAAQGHGAVEIDQPNLLNQIDVTQQNLDREVSSAVGYLAETGIEPPPGDLPNPFSVPGCWGTSSGGVFGPTWPFKTNNVQSTQGLEYGYDVPNLKVLDPNVTWDVEALCDPTWVSPFDYTSILNILSGGTASFVLNPLPLDLRSPGRVKPASQLRAQTLTQDQTPITLTLGTYLQVSGTLGATSASLNPIFSETMYGLTDPGSGTYSIVEQGSSGQAIYTRYFTPGGSLSDSFDGATSITVQGPAGFVQWIPQTAGTASIAVFDPNGNNLGSVAITGTAPTASIIAPAAGFVGSGPQVISWTAQENGVANFYSRVYYSIDQGNTWTLIGNTIYTTLAVDFSTLPGSPSALIRVDVSDGANTGSATSAPFVVPKKVPAGVVITSPASGSTRFASKPFYLVGAAYDPDDGSLTGTALAWSDNIAGALGTGSPLAVTLQPGPHTITLTATDSDGNAISTTTQITVAGAAPVVTVSTSTLSTNCVSATIGAAPGNQGLALSTVQYSLDGGNTYTSIPLSALPYSFVVPSSSSVNVLAYATDASGQIGAQSAPVSLTGVCAAGIPFVSAGSSQVTPINSVFSTPLAVQISNSSGSPVAGVVVSFAAPASGASATLSAPSATTGANGIAGVTATANSTSGAYQVIASVSGFSTTAQFNLTNTDFTLGLNEPSLTIQHGYVGFNTVSVTPLFGFNSPVTLGCSGLPDGVTCSFSPATVTPSGSTAYSTLTISDAGGANPSASKTLNMLSGGSLALALCLLVPGFRRRGKCLGISMLLAIALALCSANGCGGSFHPLTSSVTVNATSGSLTHSSIISLSVK